MRGKPCLTEVVEAKRLFRDPAQVVLLKTTRAGLSANRLHKESRSSNRLICGKKSGDPGKWKVRTV